MNFWNNIIIRKYLLIIILGLLSLNSFSQELIEVKALSGNVSVFVPKNFGVMPMHILEIKYPTSRRPTEALSNKTGTVSLVFNHTTNAMKPSQIREAHTFISKNFHNTFPDANWIRDEVIEQNGSAFMVMELITPAVDDNIHNILYGTSVDGRFLIVAFNTTIEESAEWLAVGKRVMASLSVR